jgi:hypothetical protein
MTSMQNQAIWELCRQGLHGAAARAEQSWHDGKGFVPGPQVPLTREVALLIERANWDLGNTMAPRRAARTSELEAQTSLAAG